MLSDLKSVPTIPFSTNTAEFWYCVRSQPKHEHIAAANLRRNLKLDVFVPRLRFRRPTTKGLAWVTEALFPSYLFARFCWETELRNVIHANGVAGVVHFGSHWPTIPDGVVEALRQKMGEAEVHTIQEAVSPGEQVRIIGGTFHDFEGVITMVMPSRQRVAVLLEFLGRQTPVEVNLHEISRCVDQRRTLFGQP